MKKREREMSKVVKDESGDIHVVPSNKEEESGGKRSFFAVRVHFGNGGFADIAYYQEKNGCSPPFQDHYEGICKKPGDYENRGCRVGVDHKK